ncbi:MAG TPA: RDD family protein [Thermoanaerobaculia bacterium]|jgi:uncharacterized RDD family membrane protein YckC
MLDTTRTVETPEGVELGLRLAGPAVRAYAWAIDFAIRIAAYTVMSIPLAFFGQVGMGIYLVLVFLVEWFYPVYFEVHRDGATPGKRSLGIRVLHDDGTPVSWGSSMVRNLVRFADLLPVAYGFGLASMLIHPDFKRLGDLAAGTLVVHRVADGQPASIPEAPPRPPGAVLTLPEQRAILEFAERQTTWSAQRSAELATLARPLTGLTGYAGHAALLGIANWLVGRR